MEQIADDHRLSQNKGDHRPHGQHCISFIRIGKIFGNFAQILIPEHIPKGQGQDGKKENRAEDTLTCLLCHVIAAPLLMIVNKMMCLLV